MMSLKVYSRAKDLLEKDGWVQGTAHTLDGRRCLTSAIHDAAEEIIGTSHSCYELFQPLISKVKGEQLASWNDGAGRTKKEVIDLLDSVSH